jgi:ribonuclease G
MSVIDVNSGSFRAQGNYEENILKLNLEAATEIARQIVLRDIGGLNVIDFIDMVDHENRNILYNSFRKMMAEDKSPIRIIPPNDFCIVMISRKKEQKSVLEKITSTCPTCEGTGFILSTPSVVAAVERWFMRAAENKDGRKFLLFVNPITAKELSDENNRQILDIEEKYEISIEVYPEVFLHPEKFIVIDVVSGDDITDRYLSD